jgi:hypothetical protein
MTQQLPLYSLYSALQEASEAVWKYPDEPVTEEHAVRYWRGVQAFVGLLEKAKWLGPTH